MSRVIRCLLLLTLGAAVGCKMCTEEIWNSVPSPDGKWKARHIIPKPDAICSRKLHADSRGLSAARQQ
jgi:hypothetical protein